MREQTVLGVAIKARAAVPGLQMYARKVGPGSRMTMELPNSAVAPDEALAALGTSRENASRSADSEEEIRGRCSEGAGSGRAPRGA